MLQSIERGRRPEVDFLNGYVVEKGREKGVPTPLNAALASMIEEIAAGTRETSPNNLEGLLH
jgi:2-dehydropantoate 2-reductase